MAKVKDAEVIVYTTPIYYYEMYGQMKTMVCKAGQIVLKRLP